MKALRADAHSENPCASGSDKEMLETLQRETFRYFDRHVNPENGLVADKGSPDAPSSIAAVGLGLSAYTVAVQRGLMPRATAVARTLAALRFLNGS